MCEQLFCVIVSLSPKRLFWQLENCFDSIYATACKISKVVEQPIVYYSKNANESIGRILSEGNQMGKVTIQVMLPGEELLSKQRVTGEIIVHSIHKFLIDKAMRRTRIHKC